ncbi:hypothetical protein ACVRC9_004934, partial [Escherichia coli]
MICESQARISFIPMPKPEENKIIAGAANKTKLRKSASDISSAFFFTCGQCPQWLTVKTFHG